MKKADVVKLLTDKGYTVNRYGAVMLRDGETRIKFNPKAVRIEKRNGKEWFSIGSQYYGKLAVFENAKGCTVLGPFINYQLFTRVHTVNLNLTNI